MISAGTVPCAVAASAASRVGAGLVSTTTKAGRPVEIDRHGGRVRRMRRAVGHSARLLHFDSTAGSSRVRKVLVTLTYADGDAWRPNHIRQFTRRVRDWCRDRRVQCRFVWVGELQKRGALHYHVLVWIPRRFVLPKPDKRGWWPHGSTNVKEAQHAVSYIAKYASKTTAEQAAGYPPGARMHGAGGLDQEARRHVRYWQAPEWVRDALTGRADIRKVPGGYADKLTGEFLPSPWHVFVTPGGRVWAWRESEVVQ